MRAISSLVSGSGYVAQNGTVWATKGKGLHTKCIFATMQSEYIFIQKYSGFCKGLFFEEPNLN